jgi:spermidine synthase
LLAPALVLPGAPAGLSLGADMTESQAAIAPGSREKEAPYSGLAEVVFWCFLVSGATSLILEGTLMRELRFVLGNTTLAITTVLCAFMAGLALGSYISGRLCDRAGRLLRWYGLLEGAVGVCCLLLPACIQALEPAYRWMYLHLQDTPLALSMARFLLCGVLLLIPSTFMGATLPILTRWASLRQGRIGRSIASLYAINSAGAAAGALVCGFLLLPELGVTWTLRLACVADIAICVLMLVLDGRDNAPVVEAVPERQGPSEAGRTDAAAALWRSGLLVSYGLSGAAALVYEVAWTRGLALVVGSSTYAFSLMLAAFILGLAIGSAIMVRLIDRVRDRVYWFAAVEIGIGLSAMIALPVIGQLPVLIVGIVRDLAGSFAILQGVEFLLMLLVMMIPTTLMGAAFPLVCRACARGAGGVGHSVGSVYAVNTVGGIVGTFVGSFILIPTIGTQNAILVATAANILIGVVLALLAPGAGWVRRAAPALVVLPFGLWAGFGMQPWDPSIIASGAYIYASRLAPVNTDADSIRQRMRRVSVIYHKEDICTAVTVREYPNGVRTLAVGGKVDASSRGDLSTQLLLAHAPLLLHPKPKSALVIGLASGITLGSAACYDLERIDCAEISPAVVEASHYFDAENGHVLKDPRVRLIVGDGRNHLSLTTAKYDVIISEPSNPWIAGVGDLFTKEFFELCKGRLNSGGLACVWLHAYQLDEPLFRSVVRTFHDTFGHMVIVESIPMMDYLLIGSAEPLRMPYASLTSRFYVPTIATDLQRISIREPLDFLRRIVVSGSVESYVKDAVLHTDDNALLEFAAPRTLYRNRAEVPIAEGLNPRKGVDLSFLTTDPGQQDRLSSLRMSLEPLMKAQVLGAQAVAAFGRGQTEEAFAAAGEAARLDPAGPEVLNFQGKTLLRQAMDLQDEAYSERARKDAAAIAPNLKAMFQQQITTFIDARDWLKAVDVLQDAAFFQPSDLTLLDNLAWLQATCPDAGVRNGREALDMAELCCQTTNHVQPGYLKTLAAAYAETGRFEEAVRTAEKALGLARQTGQTSLAGDIETQLSGYRLGKAYHLPER